MALFLSEQWFDALAHALQSIPADSSSERVVIGQLVTGCPTGDVGYAIAVGGGLVPDLVRPLDETIKVTLVEDYEAARAIATGTPAGELLAQGRIKVRGDANILIEAYERLSVLSGALESLAGSTEY